MAAGTDEKKVEWIREAIRCVATADADAIVMGSTAKWGASPARGRPDSRKLLPVFGGMHSHNAPELCFGLTGTANMCIGEHVYSFAPPRMALLLPGIVHAESYSRQQQPYAVMWLHYCSDRSLLALVSEYKPDAGWNCPARYSLRSRSV